MNPGLDAAGPALAVAFQSALARQLGIVIAILLLLLPLAGSAARRWRPAARPPQQPPVPEPRPRRFIRIAFGVLWLVDGVLQAQPGMAGGLPSAVAGPAAAVSPRWVQEVVNAGLAGWDFHPVQAAAAAVWIQIGLGLWLLAADAGWWSRLAGLASAAWALVVWVFGEAFGGIFAPGLSWLTGAPGAVALYLAAGALLALPARAWAGSRPRRLLLGGTGLCWAALAVLQAWPGRGFWQGGDSGSLTGTVQDMAQLSQPHAQAAVVSAFASFTAAHGFAVNLAAVIALAALGLALLSGQPRLLRAAVPAAIGFCLADWVLVQDLGVLGGLGTDPNSMLPWAVLLWGGYLAVTGGRTGQAPPSALRQAMAAARPVTTLGAIGIIVAGAAPMAAAAVNRQADPIIAQAVSGAPVPLNRPAPGFRLASQSGQPVSLASLRGKAVLLTFLDPVCADCGAIAQELRAARSLLGTSGKQVELVAIAADATHAGPVFIRAFDHHYGLGKTPGWLFLTGTPAQLQQVWTRYEQVRPHLMAGMTARSDVAFVIGKTGRIRQEIPDNPWSGTAAMRSSFAVLLSAAVRQALR
jgi:cytochrome oxidase Cu insertion factor (SCO1/SenC/PrrC family)